MANAHKKGGIKGTGAVSAGSFKNSAKTLGGRLGGKRK